MIRRSIVTATLALAFLGHVSPSMAQEAPPREEAPARTEESESSGAHPVGVVLMIVGGIVAAVGATVLVVDAASEEEVRDETGLDPGLSGVRGRSDAVAADDGGGTALFGAALLGGGTLVHVIGVVVAFGGDDVDEKDDAPPPPPSARMEAVVSPGFSGLRGTF